MRKMLIGLILLIVVVSGCGMPTLGTGLFDQLQGLGPTVCTVYDFNSDGTVTTDELRQIFGDAFSDADLQAALDFYGCE